MRIPRLFCLVDETVDVTVLPALVAAGVDGFQVRAKAVSDRELLDLTRRVIAFSPGAPVLVNDRVDIALAAGAAGVHLGADDFPVEEARRLAPGLMIGGTCRGREAAIAARDAGANYVGFGPVFATLSKSGLPDPLGTEAITGVADVLPVIAIGGITRRNVAEVRASGAHGIAVIGSIWSSHDPVAAVKELAS